MYHRHSITRPRHSGVALRCEADAASHHSCHSGFERGLPFSGRACRASLLMFARMLLQITIHFVALCVVLCHDADNKNRINRLSAVHLI